MPREALDDTPPFDGGVDTKTLPGIEVSKLQEALEPIRLACEKKSVIADFRFVQINPENIVIIGSMTSVKVALSLGFKDAFSIDAQTFCGVVSFLPKGARVVFDLKDGVLHWKCGGAKGKLATAEAKNLAFSFTMLPKDWPHEPMKSDPAFGRLIERGALSGNNNMLAGGGFSGAVIYPNGDKTVCVSSDNATMAVATAQGLELPCDVPVYIHPSAVPLLVALSKRDGDFYFNDKAICFKGGAVQAFINQIVEPKFDFLSVAEKYMEGNMCVPIDKTALTMYAKRVAEVSERSNRAIVNLTVNKNGIVLKFTEGTIENEEMFEVAALVDLQEEMELRIGADNLSNALAYCDKVILDYVDRNVISFQGADFQYIISGKPKIVSA